MRILVADAVGDSGGRSAAEPLPQPLVLGVGGPRNQQWSLVSRTEDGFAARPWRQRALPAAVLLAVGCCVLLAFSSSWVKSTSPQILGAWPASKNYSYCNTSGTHSGSCCEVPPEAFSDELRRCAAPRFQPHVCPRRQRVPPLRNTAVAGGLWSPLPVPVCQFVARRPCTLLVTRA